MTFILREGGVKMGMFKEMLDRKFNLGLELELGNGLSEDEKEVWGILMKIIERLEKGEYYLDAFFRVIQDSEFEGLMYKKPYQNHGKGIKLEMKGLVYVYFNGESYIERQRLVEEYKWIGGSFAEMVKIIEERI